MQRAMDDFVIPEAQDAKSSARQVVGSLLISHDSVLMLATIDLDDQPSLQAHEVDDEALEGMLTSELRA